LTSSNRIRGPKRIVMLLSEIKALNYSVEFASDDGRDRWNLGPASTRMNADSHGGDTDEIPSTAPFNFKIQD
jgi:hypothetical protein